MEEKARNWIQNLALKKRILTSVWSVQYPNAGQNFFNKPLYCSCVIYFSVELQIMPENKVGILVKSKAVYVLKNLHRDQYE